jgi:hypothetical protein
MAMVFAGAGAVLHHHGLPEANGELFGDRAGDDVERAACALRHQHVDRPRRPALRQGSSFRAAEEGGDQHQPARH